MVVKVSFAGAEGGVKAGQPPDAPAPAAKSANALRGGSADVAKDADTGKDTNVADVNAPNVVEKQLYYDLKQKTISWGPHAGTDYANTTKCMPA